MMSLGATCGFEIGGGFELCDRKGTEVHRQAQSAVYGGIRGGLSTGERVIFRVGFKPTSSIMDTAKKGRHDPCIVPRAVPVVEAMTWAVLADLDLLSRLNRADTY
jgi:chorismate synthase